MLRSNVFKRAFSSGRQLFDTLAFVEVSKAKVTPSSLSTITAAAQVGEPITAIVVGPEGHSATDQVAKIAGVSKVVSYNDGKYEHYLAEELAPLFKQVLDEGNYKHFFAPASAVGKSVLPRVSALMDVQPLSDIIKIESLDTFVRPIYAGNALATVKSKEPVILATVRGSAFAQAEIGENAVQVEEKTDSIDSGNRTEFVSEDLVTSERPELASASRVVAGGRALKNKEHFEKLLEPLASKLHAAIGASRVAVDSGFCDNSLQVGQTGKVVAPDLYIAIGISGAIQHLAGMKDAKTIVAINKDPEAPIFKIADIGLVADIDEAVPELTEKLP